MLQQTIGRVSSFGPFSQERPLLQPSPPAAHVVPASGDAYEPSSRRASQKIPPELWAQTAQFCRHPDLVRLAAVSRAGALAARHELRTRYAPSVAQKARALHARYAASVDVRERQFAHWYAQRVRVADCVREVRELGKRPASYGLPSCLASLRRQTDSLLRFRGESGDEHVFRLRRDLAGARWRLNQAHGLPRKDATEAMPAVDRAWLELFAALDAACDAVKALHEAALAEGEAHARHRHFLRLLS